MIPSSAAATSILSQVGNTVQANDCLNPCAGSCMWGRDTLLCVRLSSVVERCPVHAVKGTLPANVSYLFLLNPCLQCWHLVNPGTNKGIFHHGLQTRPLVLCKMDPYFGQGDSFIPQFNNQAYGRFHEFLEVCWSIGFIMIWPLSTQSFPLKCTTSVSITIKPSFPSTSKLLWVSSYSSV